MVRRAGRRVPVVRLAEELVFPDPRRGGAEGLVAVGGDLDPQRLVLAYASGLFPWFGEGEPILWWSPRPRLVLDPNELHVGRSLAKVLRRGQFRLTFDRAFAEVIAACAGAPRPGQDGTWITADMQRAYVELHARGFAHSVEAWDGDELVGGLYGVGLGAVFFGESMFARRDDASKVAFVRAAQQLARWGVRTVDCQVRTEHLVRFGAREVELDAFLERIAQGLAQRTRRGPWVFDADLAGGPG
jgi:leucyl/phenylalanyl-tRNA--protein transferase